MLHIENHTSKQPKGIYVLFCLQLNGGISHSTRLLFCTKTFGFISYQLQLVILGTHALVMVSAPALLSEFYWPHSP